MTLKIYGDPGSGSTRRVTAVAQHLQVDAGFIFVDILKGESHSPDFLQMNPNGVVPVLTDGETTVFEASAINIYLAEKVSSDLYPQGPARFEVLQWMFWSGEEWRAFSAALFGEAVGKRLFGHQPDPARIDAISNQIRKPAAVLDRHLEGRRFIAGDRLSLADFDIAAPFSQIDRAKPPFAEFPNLMRWHQTMLDEVPAWRKTLEELDARFDPVLQSMGITF